MKIKIRNVSKLYSLIYENTLRCQCLRYQELVVCPLFDQMDG